MVSDKINWNEFPDARIVFKKENKRILKENKEKIKKFSEKHKGWGW